jgi:hypothetical protein
LFSQGGGHVYRFGVMAARTLFAALALVACAPATQSVSTAPAVAPVTTFEARVAPRRHRHLARLTPPFGAASGARRVADDAVATALVSAP